MTPLYILAKNRDLPRLEIMDEETLKWIEQGSLDYIPSDNIQICKIILNSKQIEDLNKLIPSRKYFLRKSHYSSIHGITHIIRVMFNVLFLCKLLKIDQWRLYLIAACVHDLRRENDNTDKGHGDRAANWFLANLKLFERYLNRRDNSITRIVEMVKYHEVDNSIIPKKIWNKYSTEIDIIKSADALDRFRQPDEKWWPDPKRIPLEEAAVLLNICREFTIKSERLLLQGLNPTYSVFEAAKSFLVVK